MKLLHASVGLWLFQSAAAGPSKAAFVKRALETSALTKAVETRRLVQDAEVDCEFDEHPHFRRHLGDLSDKDSDSINNNSGTQRRNQQDFSKEENCDQSLLTCLPEQECADCFRYLYSENIDWGTVTPETSCDEVLGFLEARSYCKGMHDPSESDAKDAFCNSFNACAVWENGEAADDGSENEDPNRIDCNALTDCDWPGIHRGFIGDGNCHDSFDGCYNTAICGFDGGDCCEDTCKNTDYVTCGQEGFACRSPNSTECDWTLTYDCESAPGTEPPMPVCGEGDTTYRIIMYDSFGDGWDQTNMTVAPSDKKTDVRFYGRLKEGSRGTEFMCLPKDSACIHVDVLGGEWGNEVSWEIRPLREGAPALAGGGSPMSCDFSVGAESCESTCTGKPNIAPNNDPDYKEFKDMYTCIEDHCAIQVGLCEKDATCSVCLKEEKEDFCYGSEAFIAVVDCTMCQCTERKGSEFCDTKLSPGMAPHIVPNPSGNGRESDGSPRPCSPAETMKGSDAVLTFGGCTNMDQVSMLVKNYDSNNFGLLDSFEACAHKFQAAPDKGGDTALGCMQILVDAMNAAADSSGEYDDNDTDGAMVEAAATLASLLYHNAGDFCECSSKASADCPLCSSFIHVKTLLFESLDACNSLDEIDCDAWAEFQKPCEKNILKEFGEVDFSSEETCTFVHENCGGAGPFPAFRRLDCEDELPKPSWDFYNDFAHACLKNGSDGKYQPRPTPASNEGDVPQATPSGNPPTPAPTPYKPVTPATKRPTKPYIPSGGSGGSPPGPAYPTGGGSPTKPYSSDDDDSTDSSSSYSSSGKKKRHPVRNFFLVCLVGGIGCYFYKRRTDAFSFGQYRNTRNYAGGESEMYSSAPYSGLSSSGDFQPPSLPPTPSAIDQGY